MMLPEILASIRRPKNISTEIVFRIIRTMELVRNIYGIKKLFNSRNLNTFVLVCVYSIINQDE